MCTLILIGIVVIKRDIRGFIQERGGRAVSRLEQEARRSYAEQEVEEAILSALKGLRFGSVEITVHDSRVVQIERKEKVRIDRP
ncbi:MAG TPA: hypothetical protein DDY39_01990 [Nitrospira sp.]|nr:hypothetical protein [Nitrospira sp.]HBR52581.1 hypothetical protein [Nitrospira sp.]